MVSRPTPPSPGTRRIALLTLMSLCLFTLFRVIFWSYDHALFTWQPRVLLVGLYFDAATVGLLCLPFWTLYLAGLLIHIRGKLYYRILEGGWGLTMILSVFCNLVDVAYFPFVRRRSSLDTFQFTGEALQLTRTFVLSFWLLFVLGGALIAGGWYVYHKVARRYAPAATRGEAVITLGVYLGVLVLLNFPPGQEIRFLTPSAATVFVTPEEAPLVTNTTLALIHSTLLYARYPHLLHPLYDVPQVTARAYTDHYFPRRAPVGPATSKNIVIVILESFSEAYMDGPDKATTPFLDSIRAKSLVFTNAYANGASSVAGFESVLASIPPLLQNSTGTFLLTPFGNDRFPTLEKALADRGYTTSYFIGCYDGHFGYNKMATALGIRGYYGRAAFNDERFFDGGWGIYDRPFFRYAGQVIAGQPGHFFATVFNISSHVPYFIPPSAVRPGISRREAALEYVDGAVRDLFAEVSKRPDYRNTLFVFVGDHASPDDDNGIPRNPRTNYRIPIWFHATDGSLHDTSDVVFQQVDIVPTLCDLLHLPDTVTTFGHSYFAPAPLRFAVMSDGDQPQMITDRYVVTYTGNGCTFLDTVYKPCPALDSLCTLLKVTRQVENNAVYFNALRRGGAVW